MNNIKAPVWLALAGALVMVALTGFQAATSDGTLADNQEIIQIAIQGVMTFSVWAAANLPGQTWIKTAVAAVLAVLNILVTAIIGGVHTAEWLNMAIAVLVAVGIPLVPTPVTRTINGEVVTTVKGRPVPRSQPF